MDKTVLNVKNSVNREKFLSTLPLSTGHTLKFKHIIDVDILILTNISVAHISKTSLLLCFVSQNFNR